MNRFVCGSLSALALLAFTSPLRAQTADPGVELAFMPRTMTVTLLNDGGKYVAVDLKHISQGGTCRMDKDATIARVKRVNAEGLEYCEVYDEQLRRWRNERPTDAQQRETVRLQNAARELRLVLTQILALADELATGTIERQLSKSDAELGLEHLLRSHPAR